MLFAEAESCVPCVNHAVSDYVKAIDSAEKTYLSYRWHERRLRGVVYGPLWKARWSASHPTKSEVRKKALRRERRLISVVNSLSKKSETDANEFAQALSRLRNIADFYRRCFSSETDRSYFEIGYKYIVPLIESLEARFDVLLETERDYRKEVFQTAGGPDGLYPQDSIEAPVDHAPFYDRFERDKEELRYYEDAEIGNLFDRLRQMIEDYDRGMMFCAKMERDHASSIL